MLDSLTFTVIPSGTPQASSTRRAPGWKIRVADSVHKIQRTHHHVFETRDRALAFLERVKAHLQGGGALDPSHWDGESLGSLQPLRTIIAGGRDYVLQAEDFELLDRLRVDLPIGLVISGTARGADRGGEIWATRAGIAIEKYPANWDRYGRSAGFLRNQEMVDVAEALVAFPGGAGTAHTVRLARQARLKVVVVQPRSEHSG